jgi:hypothetical protein
MVFRAGSRPHVQFGTTFGFNTNFFKYKNINQRDVAAGFQGGVFIRVTRQKAFAQVETNYLWSEVFLKNGIFTNSFGKNIPFDQLTFKYHTFGIPFIFGCIPVKKSIYKLRVYNGIEADFIMNAKAVLTQNDNEIYRLKRKEKKDILKPAQFSYQMGIGMDVAMFVIDVKYNLGFRSFYREKYRTQTHLFQVTAGFIF